MAQRDVLEIHLFGGFSLFHGGEQLPSLPSRHARLLLAWLVLNAGRPQPRTVLADMLWPDLPEARGRRRLSHALWQVQDCLADRASRPYILTPGDGVLFDAEAPYELDVEEFERALDSLELTGELDVTSVRTLRRCVELYHGELLAGSYEQWVLDEQNRLRQRHIDALGRLVEACKQRGNFDEALSHARRLTHEAPLREDAHREVMRLCVLLGQPSQALEQFERCRSVMVEELGAEPSAATVALREQIAESRAVAPVRPSPVEQLVSRRLVGRQDERVALVDQLERTLAGTPGVVLLEGDAGIGKSELLAQAAEDARWRGFTVMWGRCEGPGVPYGAIRDALAPTIDDVRVAQLRTIVEPVWLAAAATLLPELARAGVDDAATRSAPTALDGTDGAARMRESLTRVVSGTAVLEPTLLVIDDVHRADAETLSLLQGLVRATEPGRLLVVLAARGVEARADEDVWAALRAIDRDAQPVRLRLEPITAFETAGLLREVLGTAQVPASFAEAVHRESGGNPLHALELLRALRDAGRLGAGAPDDLDTVEVPVTDGLRTLVAERVAQLGEVAGSVLRVAAVLGPEFGLPSLGAAAGLGAPEVAAAIGELARRNLLDVHGDRCHFTHTATRVVVLESLGEQEASRLHAGAADALERHQPDAVEALAAHLLGAGEDRRALAYLHLAAQRALELHAYEVAWTHLASAAEISGRLLMPVEERVELLLRCERVLDVLGRRAQQREVLVELGTMVAGDDDLAVEVQVRTATHLAQTDRFDEAVGVAERALAVARSIGSGPEGRAAVALGRVLQWAGDNERAVDVLAGAVGMLLAADEPAVAARHGLGAALRSLQRFQDAERVLGHALAEAREIDDEVGEVLVLGALADLRAETGRADEAADTYDEAIEHARRLGHRHREGVGQVNLGTLQLSRGDPGPALAAYDGAQAVFEGLGNRRGVAIVQLNRAWLRHRWMGQVDEALRDADAAHVYVDQLGHHGQVAVCLETRAGVERERGDLAAARAALTDGLRAARAGSDRRAEVQVLRGEVELALADGDAGSAAVVAADALAKAEALHLEEFIADLASLRGVALLADPEHDRRAVEAVREVVHEHLVTAGEPHRIHHRLARMAAALGQDAVAREHHLTAHRLLLEAVDGLHDRDRSTALAGAAEHRAICAEGDALAPQRLELRVARADAPRGRALEESETLVVAVEFDRGLDDPTIRRRALLQVVGQIESQGAQATVGDLSAALDVSPSTVRRDLRALRTEGHVVRTRGAGTG